MRDDLPTLDRPEMQISGNPSSGRPPSETQERVKTMLSIRYTSSMHRADEQNPSAR